MLSKKAISYLETVRIPLHLSCITPTGWPIGLSLWYVYLDGKIYCATQENAKVVTYLSHNQRCSFEVSSDHPPYCGVRGQALSKIDKSIGADILKQLLIRYLEGLNNPLATRLLKNASREVAIVLSPTRYFTWDYTQRMLGSLTKIHSHPCP